LALRYIKRCVLGNEILFLEIWSHFEPRVNAADVSPSFRVYQGHTGQYSPGPN
jgi:hypothetical protein